MRVWETLKPFFWFLVFAILLVLINTDFSIIRISDREVYVSSQSDSLYWQMNGGKAETIDGAYYLEEEEMRRRMQVEKRNSIHYNKLWHVGYGKMASALGSDLQHHFAPSFLCKYKPFNTEDLWIPLYTIASRKAYMYDHEQYYGYKEIWQNSIEAYKNTRGDCEDHSMILCDWLNALGYEARVAVGHHDGNGHAWVVLYMGEETFILEATKKSNLKGNSHYPLAKLLPKYRPTGMFDHDHYFVPIDRNLMSHDKEAWVKSTVFKRNLPL